MSLYKILNPGVPWWVALPCNAICAVGLGFAIAEDLTTALAVLLSGAVALYGTALILWLRRRLHTVDDARRQSYGDTNRSKAKRRNRHGKSKRRRQ